MLSTGAPSTGPPPSNIMGDIPYIKELNEDAKGKSNVADTSVDVTGVHRKTGHSVIDYSAVYGQIFKLRMTVDILAGCVAFLSLLLIVLGMATWGGSCPTAVGWHHRFLPHDWWMSGQSHTHVVQPIQSDSEETMPLNNL